MVSRPAAALTKISFRRDVKLFLGVLAGFFIVLVSILLILLQQLHASARDATWRHWNSVADLAASQIAGAQTTPDPATLFTGLAGRYGVAAADVQFPRQKAVHVGEPLDDRFQRIERSGAWGRVALYFDTSALAAQRRTILVTAVIALAASISAVVLILLYIPRITGPIEQMLDQAAQLERHDPAVDEQEFLIDTFRKSIHRLKAQQEELRVLHDAQKSRADDFERVTAALMRGLTSGLLAIGADGRIADINDAAREMLRVEAADVVGREIGEALGEGAFAGVVRDALAQRTPLTRVETTHTTHGGAQLVIGVTTVPLLNEAGELLGMLALFTDLTSIRTLEDRVRDLQALADLGEMSAGIAHEFRNSLSAILGYLKLAQRGQQTPDDVANKVRRAEDEASQLSAAVASLLSFARPMDLHPEPIDLRELVDSVVARLEPAANGITMHVDGAATIAGDRALLSRAIENVIRNAVESVQAKGNNGSGRVDVAIDGRTLTVRDNGVGLDPQDAARMFLPFQSDKPAGFGLGLALTKKIVLLHGGAVRLTGAKGEGAVVEMQLG